MSFSSLLSFSVYYCLPIHGFVLPSIFTPLFRSGIPTLFPSSSPGSIKQIKVFFFFFYTTLVWLLRPSRPHFRPDFQFAMSVQECVCSSVHVCVSPHVLSCFAHLQKNILSEIDQYGSLFPRTIGAIIYDASYRFQVFTVSWSGFFSYVLMLI